MFRGEDVLEVLRLLVLLCAAGGGLPRRHWDGLRTQLLHSYGHEHLLTLAALEKAGEVPACGAGRAPGPPTLCTTPCTVALRAICVSRAGSREGACRSVGGAWRHGRSGVPRERSLRSCPAAPPRGSAGLLRPSGGGKNPFPAVRKALRLLVPEAEAAGGSGGAAGGGGEVLGDVSALFKGYAPLSIRLVEAALR